jgi:hypothetical protein
MGLQAFAVRQFGGNGAQLLRPGFAHFDQAAALLEVVHTQGLEKRAVPLVGSTWLGPAQ